MTRPKVFEAPAVSSDEREFGRTAHRRMDTAMDQVAAEVAAAALRRIGTYEELVFQIADDVQHILDEDRSTRAAAERNEVRPEEFERAFAIAMKPYEQAAIQGGNPLDLARVKRDTNAWVNGLGLIEIIAEEKPGKPHVEDLQINGGHSTYVNVTGRKVPLPPVPRERLDILVERLQASGATEPCAENNPAVPINLTGTVTTYGQELNARGYLIHPSISHDGWTISVRYHPTSPYRLSQLVQWGMLPSECADWLLVLALAKFNIIFVGATGSGKTTLQNALIEEFPDQDRCIFVGRPIEQIPSKHNRVILNMHDKVGDRGSQFGIRESVDASLRLRPERLCIQEVWGDSFSEIVEALMSGHRGAIMTAHAETEEQFIRHRAPIMYRRERPETSDTDIIRSLVMAYDVLVHTVEDYSPQEDRMVRRVMSVSLVSGMKFSRDGGPDLSLTRTFAREDVDQPLHCYGVNRDDFTREQQLRLRQHRMKVPVLSRSALAPNLDGEEATAA